MKNKIHVIADAHMFSGKCLGYTVQYLIDLDESLAEKGEALYLVGDIVDLNNAMKKDIREAQIAVRKLTSHFGDRYILGNHEGKVPGIITPNYEQVVIIDGIAVKLIHGHRFFWLFEKGLIKGQKKIDKWEDKEFKGIHPINWQGMRLVHWFDERYHRKHIKASPELVNAFEVLGQGVDVVIFGHKHPTRLFDSVFMNTRFIGCPRGLTTLSITR